MLLTALRSFHVALGSFAASALILLLGAVPVPARLDAIAPTLAATGVVVGLLAVPALVCGAAMLVRETRMAMHTVEQCVASGHGRFERAEDRVTEGV